MKSRNSATWSYFPRGESLVISDLRRRFWLRWTYNLATAQPKFPGRVTQSRDLCDAREASEPSNLAFMSCNTNNSKEDLHREQAKYSTSVAKYMRHTFITGFCLKISRYLFLPRHHRGILCFYEQTQSIDLAGNPSRPSLHHTLVNNLG